MLKRGDDYWGGESGLRLDVLSVGEIISRLRSMVPWESRTWLSSNDPEFFGEKFPFEEGVMVLLRDR